MRGKNIITTLISIILSIVMATIPSLQTLAEDSQNAGEYISEVKIGVGKTEKEAAAALKGYTILKNGNEYADLNKGAGGGLGSKGNRVVLFGYKTTNNKYDAITDLAVINMKGGYSVKDYELLMQNRMTEQIVPFVEKFVYALEEYRENYNSENSANKARAKYVHDALNKLTDDDCGNAGLGDLLLNETQYEMSSVVYEALSEEEAKQHADILTIISQANGKATLMMEALLTRAADTSDENWIERFEETTYDDLLALHSDMLPSDAAVELAKEYDDDAKEILAMWTGLNEQLEDYDKKTDTLKAFLAKNQSENDKILQNYDIKTATNEQTKAFAKAFAETHTDSGIVSELFNDIALHDYLSLIEYGDGTLLDFFTTNYDKIKDDITILYPLVASLSAGQRAGLEFITLSDLISQTMSDVDGYENADLNGLPEASIYENVDRDIYTKGGVALTNEAIRGHSVEELMADKGKISTLTFVMYGITAASAIAFGASFFNKFSSVSEKFTDTITYDQTIKELTEQSGLAKDRIKMINGMMSQLSEGADKSTFINDLETATTDYKTSTEALDKTVADGPLTKYQVRSVTCTKLIIGLGFAMVVLASISIYLTYRDLVNYYNVDYAPIPHYIVDEKNITAYNLKGEKVVLNNTPAYYKAVNCNRAEGDEYYEVMGDNADLNGNVGRQWLALYSEKNQNASPILASSLKVVYDNTDVPADYTTGIHMFGASSAFNLNNTQYVWNNKAKGIFVYFNVDDSAMGEKKNEDKPAEKETDPAEKETEAETEAETKAETKAATEETTAESKESLTQGSGFSSGAMALSGGIGLVAGALIVAAINLSKKKKNRE